MWCLLTCCITWVLQEESKLTTLKQAPGIGGFYNKEMRQYHVVILYSSCKDENSQHERWSNGKKLWHDDLEVLYLLTEV